MYKKKILFMLHIPPPVHGSAIVGSYLKNSQNINDVFNCQYINMSTSRSVDEIGKNPIGKIIRYLTIIKQVFACLISFKPDICYFAIAAKDIGFYKDAEIAFLLKLFRKKIVYHFHNKGVALRKDRLFDDFFYKLAFKNTHAILLSGYLYEDIQKYYPPQNVFYCPNGIPEVKNDLKKNNGKTVNLLFLSNLIASKGVFILLDACVKIKEQGIDFICNFVGAETKEISAFLLDKEIRERELSEHVRYHGAKYGPEKQSHLALCDIFVSPTCDDCFPLAIIEAMQYRIPIISTFEGGIPDIVIDKKTGFLCQCNNVEELTDKLSLLITDERLRIDMGNSGYEHYKNNFTSAIFEKKMIEILNSIC